MAVRDVPMSGTAEPEDDEPSKSTTNPHGWKNQYEPPEESGTPSAKKMVTVFEDLDEVRAVRRRGQTRAHPAARIFLRGPWEMLATILIAAGVVMLMQPFFLGLYTYSFIVTLTGTVMFIIVSHFPE